MKRALIGLVVVGTVLAGLFALLRSPAGPIRLAYKYRTGETTRYRMSLKGKVDDPAFFQLGLSSSPARNSRLRQERKVLKVNKDGSARIEVNLTLTGGDYACPGYPYYCRITLSRTGRAVESGDLSDNELYEPGSDIIPMGLLGYSAVLPSRGVAVGDTWRQRVPFPGGGGEMEVTSTLVSDRYRLGKRRVCRIENKYEGAIDLAGIYAESGRYPKFRDYRAGNPVRSGEMKIDGSGVVYFSCEEGRVVRHDDKVRVATTAVIGKTLGGSSTGACVTYRKTAKAEATAVLVERKKGGRFNVSPSP